MLRASRLLVLLLLIPAVLAGQSLGELAKKEKDRRKKNQQQGVEVRVIGKEEVSTVQVTETSGDELEKESEASSEKVDAGKDAPPSSSSGREERETEWRARASETRERLDAAQKRFETLSQLYLGPGEYYTDESGRPLITSLEQLRGLVEEAKAELDHATRATDQLKEDARHAGVPPGWVR